MAITDIPVIYNYNELSEAFHKRFPGATPLPFTLMDEELQQVNYNERTGENMVVFELYDLHGAVVKGRAMHRALVLRHTTKLNVIVVDVATAAASPRTTISEDTVAMMMSQFGIAVMSWELNGCPALDSPSGELYNDE